MTTKKAILVVEDDHLVRQMLHEALENDYDVFLAADGFDGMQCYERHGARASSKSLAYTSPSTVPRPVAPSCNASPTRARSCKCSLTLVAPLLDQRADMVIGTRTQEATSRAALNFQQRLGNWLATTLIRWRFRVAYTDLGPFRAIRREALERLSMTDRNFGWTVEMQRSRRRNSACASSKRRCAIVSVSGARKSAGR